ncbi:MAG: hypothetical protein JNK05_20670 [Myxococcales bacterium]|nr:hypothetical protein [Myxococcales bacterium]
MTVALAPLVGRDRRAIEVPASVVAYAPETPVAGKPWLLELDPRSGRVRALLEDPVERAVINVRRARCSTRTHASLRAACAAYDLGAPSTLELRWATGVSRAALDRIEHARRTATATATAR